MIPSLNNGPNYLTFAVVLDAVEIHSSPFDIWLKYATQYATKEALNSGLFEI